MKVFVETLLINSDGTLSSSSLDIPESISVAKLKVDIASSLLGTPLLHPNFLVLRLQDRELSDHTKSLVQYSVQDSDRITCLVKESGYYDIERSFALCCSLHEVFEEVRKYYEENVRLVSEIEAVETVSQFKYLGDYHVHEGRPRFRIQIRRVKVSAKDIVSEYRVAGEEEGEERLLPISDHFNDAIRYDDCQTFPRLVALNNDMMLAMQKYVDLFENENKKILKILQTFSHNYLIIYRNLRRLRSLVEDDVDRMPELEEHEQIINQQFKQLALMNVEFSVDFYASKVLNSSQAKALRSLLPRGADTNYQLLYRASRDGKDSSSFHRQCDNRGPTVTIIKDNHGNIFGGYTSVSWDQSGDYYHDPSAFLFTLQNTHGITPTKYVKNATTHAIYCASNYGPTFGGGHDIYIDNGHTNSCYSRFPHSFSDTTGKGRSTFTPQSNFTPVEIEVWKCPSEDFRNSVILDDALTYSLREILPSTCSPTLLYRSSRDGRDATSFHHLCDNQGSTVTLIKDEEGNIFGGFASSSWHSENSYSDDLSSFLFTLRNSRGSPAIKFLRNTSVAHGIFGGVGYGPTFGGGHDIYIDSMYSDQCYCNFPYSYIDSTGLGSTVFTSRRNFIPQEIEVFRI